MAYVSLYRKYRSQSFSDLIGQDHVVRTLQSAIASGKIAHAYLFTGPRGTGKTSSARLLAKALCCEKGPAAEPCNECYQCVSITEGSNIDVHEFDAASESGVDDIRETIVEVAEYKPAAARYKVFIIDEVHDLSAKAFDALLKTIEEPPEHVVFILATTEYNKVPPTIRSRCQKFEFHRGTMADLVQRLSFVCEQEKINAEPAALAAMARMADGGYRDALTLLEQAMLTNEGTISLTTVYDQLGLVGDDVVDELLLAIRQVKVEAILDHVTELTRRGRDPRSILESLLYRLADLTRSAYGLEVMDNGDATSGAALHDTAVKLGQNELLVMRGALAEAHKVIRDITLPRLWLESELIRIAQMLNAPVPVASASAAPRTETPAARQPATGVTPQPTPTPTPAPAVAAPTLAPTPPVAATKSETVSPASEEDGLWQRTLAQLPENAPILLKLAESKGTSLEDNVLTIAVRSQMIADWLQDDPRRIAYLTKFAQTVRPNTELKFTVAKRTRREPEAKAVELPLEGKALHEAVSEEVAKGSS